MNRSRRHRAAARSLVLLRLVQACTSSGRLEMISVWLLVLKLLRATAGVKKPNGNEITEGRRDSLSQEQKEQENLPEAVSMETSQLSEISDIKDNQMDLGGKGEDKYQHSTGDNECLDTENGNSPLGTQHKSNDTANECEGNEESDGSNNQKEDMLIKEDEESNPKECVPSPEPDTDPQAQGQLVEEKINTASSFDKNEPENQDKQEAPKTEPESVLEQQIKELAISETSTESCHDNDRDDLSDCLHVEMAIVSSDSDAEEQWKTMFSPVVDDDEFGAILESNTVEVNEEMNNQNHALDDETMNQSESKAEPEEEPLMLTAHADTLEQTECSAKCEQEDVSYMDSMHHSSSTMISENEVDPSLNMKHSLLRMSVSTSELDKKLPRDYCVIQEMQSENVSTEHVDFNMARKQWQKMEEQCKAQVPQSTLKQQGGHSIVYPSMRNLERPKKDPDSDNLSLGDYQYTQFSPCSDDSGLDDTSYRSHYDDPETPVEREIRETMEREECFKRERATSRPSSSEPVQSKPRPVTLMMAKSDVEEKRKAYNTREDRCRSQRPSSVPPTFSVTASPSSKPNYHEVMANNVIILEPESHPTNQWQRGKNLLSPVTSKFHEWPSDSSNIIILETSNLIIRSASEFCLSSACQEAQESTFHNNPFFKLRSHSTLSLVDQEIKEVKQRDEEFRRQRAQLYSKEKYDTILVSPSSLQNFTYDKPGGFPAKCKSSPSSPLKARRMDRSILSCDQKFPEAPYTRVRRKSALVQRWEAAMLANQQHV